jgi:MFS family permease
VATASTIGRKTIRTNVPARLDRLPWSRFHWRIVIGLGTVWILDGLEVTIVGSIAPRLTEAGSGINLDAADIGTAAAIYVAGACVGALLFGQLTDRYGRKKLFIATLGLYLLATVATAFATEAWMFFLFRFLTGAGIGGEYAAINSAIDELIPARNRGQVDLAINGSYWVGAAIGGLASLFLLDTSVFQSDVGWRLAFASGAIIGLGILLVRRHVPESPRWLFIHGREEEAERVVDSIEREVEEEVGRELPESEQYIVIRQREAIPFREIAQVAFRKYPRRAILGLALFVGQAFLYNAVTFDLGTILHGFFDVSSSTVPLFMVVFAISNFLGPLLLGRYFDTIGRIPMIAGTYLVSAAIVALLGVLLITGSLNTWTFMALVLLTFFFASAGASSAYLTVSEVFPMETRALAIAFFFAVGTGIGGIIGPELFGQFIHSGNQDLVGLGFLIGAAAMALGGVAELRFGVRAEQRALESIATPLTAEEADLDAAAEAGDGRSGRPLGPVTPAGRREALLSRERAEEEHARAADGRAELRELRAGNGNGDGDGDDAAGERVAVVEVLIEVAELRAEGLERQAEAHEQRARAERAASEEERRAALARALLGDERARAFDQRAAALRATSGPPGARAPASPTDHPGPAEIRAAVADHWDAVRAARGLASDARAAGDAGGAATHDRTAELRAELARAAEQRAEAALHRANAQQLREQQAAGFPGGDSVEERRERRRRRETGGLRRYRPGPGQGSAFYSPGMVGTASTASRHAAMADEQLDREVEAIAAALDEHGTVDRERLADLVGAEEWGPRRFAGALREAQREGRAVSLSPSTYSPAGGGGAARGSQRGAERDRPSADRVPVA